MSEKAPKILGGTRPNVGKRFDLIIDEQQELVNGVAADEVQVQEVEPEVQVQEVEPEVQQEEVEQHKPTMYVETIDDDIPEVTTLESLCMNCREDGTTKLLMTMIPYFREVILMSFECDHCGYKNSEVQFGGKVQEQGCRIQLDVTKLEDLNRQLIKSDTATVLFPELDFEIPSKTQRGTINTIEGLLQKAVEDLRMDQDQRRTIDPETTAKIDEFLARLVLMSTGLQLPFRIVLDDPAGNSHIENPTAPMADPMMKVTHYYRSEAQDLECGLQPDMSHEKPSQDPRKLPHRNEGLDKFVEEANIAKKEVLQFPVNCHACNAPGMSCMCMTDIPHFKEVIIMSFNCESCGFRTNEVKGGGAIPPLGERITLRVTTEEPDVLDRDVLKSDSASVNIPELELEMAHGSLGGLYTTVEGLLDKVRENIEEGNPFAVGDSDGGRSKLKAWLQRLEALRNRQEPFTLIIEDPLANSFVYSPYGSHEDDPYLTAEHFKRSEYDDECLGLLDMKTEGYSSEITPIVEEDEEPMETIKSDKETMAGGGRAIDPSKYHPNPKAVMQLDPPSE